MKQELLHTRRWSWTIVRFQTPLSHLLLLLQTYPLFRETDLHGRPVQYREVEGFESAQFLSYFPHFVCLHGGVSTGFHHVSQPPPLNLRKLYRISFSGVAARFNLLVREVAAQASSLVEGDVFVLDKGAKVWQFNTKASVGKEKFKAAEFVQSLVNERQGQCDVTVYGELVYFLTRQRSI